MTIARFIGRLATATTVTAAALALPASAASAHNLGGDLVHYDSKILSISPPVDGLTATTSTGGEYLNLTNTGPHTIIVLGYKGEPYAKITKSGVWENQRSESTYLNKSLFGDALANLPNTGNPNQPDWKQVANTGSYRYHDHRIHWMGLDRPPVVKKDPGHDHLIAHWKVHLLTDGSPATIDGQLRWLKIKPTNTWAYAVPIAAALLAVLSILIIRRRRLAGGSEDRTSIEAHKPSAASAGGQAD